MHLDIWMGFKCYCYSNVHYIFFITFAALLVFKILLSDVDPSLIQNFYGNAVVKNSVKAQKSCKWNRKVMKVMKQ